MTKNEGTKVQKQYNKTSKESTIKYASLYTELVEVPSTPSTPWELVYAELSPDYNNHHEHTMAWIERVHEGKQP